jgi:hypothetical protein
MPMNVNVKVVCHSLGTIPELIRNDSHLLHVKRAYQTNNSGDIRPTKAGTVVLIGGLSKPFYDLKNGEIGRTFYRATQG